MKKPTSIDLTLMHEGLVTDHRKAVESALGLLNKTVGKSPVKVVEHSLDRMGNPKLHTHIVISELTSGQKIEIFKNIGKFKKIGMCSISNVLKEPLASSVPIRPEEARKYGCTHALGLSDTSQLKELYGEGETDVIDADMANTKCKFLTK
jgi:hypothetical protein